MRIGELANRIGVNPKTIRFYEDQGLLPPPTRRPSGYRDYGAEDESRLRFVRTAQRLGFALSEIAEILALKERGERPCGYVIGVLDRQVSDIDRRLGELVALRAELTELKAKADHLSEDGACYCQVIEHAQGGGRRRPRRGLAAPAGNGAR
jgi:DNA-binding transcriptional MerR regulator